MAENTRKLLKYKVKIKSKVLKARHLRSNLGQYMIEVRHDFKSVLNI